MVLGMRPQTKIESLEAWRREQARDAVAAILAGHGPGAAPVRDLHARYEALPNVQPLSLVNFGILLGEMGIQKRRAKGATYYILD